MVNTFASKYRGTGKKKRQKTTKAKLPHMNTATRKGVETLKAYLARGLSWV